MGCSVRSVSTNKLVGYRITCKQCYHAKLLAPKETSDESPTSPLLLQGPENSTRIVIKGPHTKASHPDGKHNTPMTVLKAPKLVVKGPKLNCHDQTLSSTRKKNSRPNTKQVASDSSSAAKRSRNNCSWGIIWKWNKKNIEDTSIDFRIKNILLKGGSDMANLEPVCHLCRKAYRSDLMYICCETCASKFFCNK